MNELIYLRGYPPALQAQARDLLLRGELGDVLVRKYPDRHLIQSDGALYDYVMALKQQYLRQSEPINKIQFDNKIHIINNALGLHTAISRVQGGKLKAKNEIRIAMLFKNLPEAFLRMIVVHELAHLKEKEHNKSFYQLCQHMEPAYYQLEFDLRLWLTWQASLSDVL